MNAGMSDDAQEIQGRHRIHSIKIKGALKCSIIEQREMIFSLLRGTFAFPSNSYNIIFRQS